MQKLTIQNKSDLFEYFIFKIMYSKGMNNVNDLSILKLQKLLFFCVASEALENKANYICNGIFDNFKTYQYGPVEEDVYLHLKMKGNTLRYFKITNKCTELNAEGISFDSFKFLHDEVGKLVIDSIDESLERLNNINSYIFNYSAFNLVEISHRWRCWSSRYPKVEKITFEDIKSDNQYYFL